MDDHQMELSQLKELVTVIEECEKTEEVIEWMKEICSVNDQQKLIETLIGSFLGNLQDIDYANQILKGLRKLNEWVPEEVLPQMRSSQKFPLAITQYLTTIQMKNMTGDGFVLLTQIFKASNFRNVTNEKFILVLFDSFEFIEDDEIFKALIAILVKISNEAQTPETNIVMKIALKHPNQRFFSETLIQLLNKCEMQEDLEVGLRFVEQILKIDPKFFYGNDFKVLLDLSIRMTEDQDGRQRYLYLRTILAISETPKFTSTLGNSRVNDLTELMFNVLNDCEEQDSKKIAQMVLDNLQK